MASVNNQPNLKPLIDDQSAAQSSELTAAAQAINTSVDSVKAELSAKSDSVKAAIDAAKALITNDAQLKADALGLALSESSNSINSAMESVRVSADFDIYNPKTLNSLDAINRSLPKLEVRSSSMEKVYGRAGGGALTYLRVHDRIAFDVFIDGVKVFDKQYSREQVYSELIPNVIPYLKYKNSVEIYANTSTYPLQFIDWRSY